MDQSKIEDWAEALASGVEAAQIDALRQISSCDAVVGLAPLVVPLAGDARDEVRGWACEAMEIAVQPEPADRPALVALLERCEDGEVGYWAVTMLGRLGAQAAAAVSALEHCLRVSGCLAARERAVWALSQIGPVAVTALPTLREVARQANHPRLQRLATEVIRRLQGSAAEEAA